MRICDSIARWVTLAAILALPACSGADGIAFPSFGDTISGLEEPVDVQFYPDDQVLAAAQNQFNEKNYGHAQHYFQRAVAIAPNDAEAWLGLAASYDHIRRFDEADEAYRQVAKLIGNRPELYNNLGYSFLLRGDLVRARGYFLKAYELDPQNEITANNLELLRDSVNHPKRG
jgi:Flp pilus assembly protein TadD